MNAAAEFDHASARLGEAIRYDLRPAIFLRSFAVAAIIWIIMASLTPSFARLIFNGALAGYFVAGLGIALISQIVVATVTSLLSSDHSSLACPQSPTAVVQGMIAASVAAVAPADMPVETLFGATFWILIFSSLITGAVLLLIGVLRAGDLVRYIPYPIVGGYMAGFGVGLVVAVSFFVLEYSRMDIIKQEFTASAHRSNLDRSFAQNQHLQAHGASVLILRLQGFLFFGTTYRLYQHARQHIQADSDAPLTHLILDFKAVSGFDFSTVVDFQKLRKQCDSRGIELLISDALPEMRAGAVRPPVHDQSAYPAAYGLAHFDSPRSPRRVAIRPPSAPRRVGGRNANAVNFRIRRRGEAPPRQPEIPAPRIGISRRIGNRRCKEKGYGDDGCV